MKTLIAVVNLYDGFHMLQTGTIFQRTEALAKTLIKKGKARFATKAEIASWEKRRKKITGPRETT